MDLAHGASFYPAARVRAAPVAAMRDADAVVIAAGRGGRPGETRLDLLRDNARVMRTLATELAGARGLLVVVTNPVDVLTRVLAEASGLPPSRVIGTGTMLDTARLRQVVGTRLGVDARSVHAQVLGEHGDSEVVAWSTAHAGGRPLRRWPEWSAADEATIGTQVRTAAYEIIQRKGATNHAIGLVTAALLGWMLRDERRVATVSRVHEQVGGEAGVALSLPTIVGRDGATTVVVPDMDDAEQAALAHSASVLQGAWGSLVGDPAR
jgi:L-lactate dehydrogenase